MPAHQPLTPEQRRAAANPLDHAFIVAAPGSGKTTVAAERYGVCRYLYPQDGRRVLGVSFARSATQELRSRVQGRWGAQTLRWPNDVMTLDSLHCELVRHLLTSGSLRWPGGHTELTVLDTWRGQANARLLLPQQGWRRVAAIRGTDVTSAAAPITQSTYGIGARAHFEAHLANGTCTHEEIRTVLRAAIRREDLARSLATTCRPLRAP